MSSIQIYCKYIGGWFVLKSIAHGSKCPIELCLPIYVGRKFSWWMFPCKRQAWDLSRQSTPISLIISRSLWSYLKLLLIYLIELGFGFDHSFPREKHDGNRRTITHSIITPTGVWKNYNPRNKNTMHCTNRRNWNAMHCTNHRSSNATVYPKKYAHAFVVLCFVVVMQSFIMNSHKVFIHIHQGCIAGTGAIVRLPQCQWSKPDGYGKIQSMYNHNKAQQSKNRVHISWDILYALHESCSDYIYVSTVS